MDGVGTGFWLTRQIYSIVKRRIENATREMVERAVQVEVMRQLQLHSAPGISVKVETVRVLVREVIVLAVHDGVLPAADFPEAAALARARRELPAPEDQQLALPPAVIDGTAHVVPAGRPAVSPERLAAMRQELTRSLHEQFGDDFELGEATP
ncbi:MAG: hypothetical protein ACJ757_12925 [Gaiellaceae bacterium]